MTLRFGILVFPNVQQLDLTGPYEVFASAKGAEVELIWKDRKPVMSSTRLSLTPTATFDDCPPLDVLCVPGGGGVNALLEDEVVLDFVRSRRREARYVTSVCSGALVLGAAGLLQGKRATTHWYAHDFLAASARFRSRRASCEDGNLITAGGVTSGIDFGLAVVAGCSARPRPRRCSSISNMRRPRRSIPARRRRRRPKCWRERRSSLRPRDPRAKRHRAHLRGGEPRPRSKLFLTERWGGSAKCSAAPIGRAACCVIGTAMSSPPGRTRPPVVYRSSRCRSWCADPIRIEAQFSTAAFYGIRSLEEACSDLAATRSSRSRARRSRSAPIWLVSGLLRHGATANDPAHRRITTEPVSIVYILGSGQGDRIQTAAASG